MQQVDLESVLNLIDLGVTARSNNTFYQLCLATFINPFVCIQV